VLGRRPLRPGASLKSTPRFHEDRWDLRAAILPSPETIAEEAFAI
jgi:hypothetical protein